MKRRDAQPCLYVSVPTFDCLPVTTLFALELIESEGTSTVGSIINLYVSVPTFDCIPINSLFALELIESEGGRGFNYFYNLCS